MKNRTQWSENIRRWIFACMGGILFAALERCGYLLQNYGTIWAVSENPWHRTVFHRILLRIPAGILAVFLLLWMTERLIKRQEGKKRDSFFLCEKKYGFPVMWLVCFCSFLPAFLGGFPGIFAADAPNQVGWTFSGWLTAHHPLVHTGLLCGIFSLARSLGWNDNTAAAIYTIIQMLALSGIFAWLLRFLEKKRAPLWLRAGTLLFLCLFPFHGLMAIYTTKDTLFAGIFVLCLMQIYQMCTEPEVYFSDNRRMAGGFGCFALLFLFRNNGFHTIFLCMPFLVVYLRKYWKKLLIMAAGLLLFYQIYNGPFLKAVGAEPGNSREMYSIIMQTLGRTYVAGGDIRPEEMDVIRPVMDEETLALYTPEISDSIKNYFHTEAFDENREEFLKTWISVGWRNKKIYVDAFLNTIMPFWYPKAGGEYLEFVCFDIEKDNPAYPHVEMTPLSRTFHRYYTMIGTDAAFRQIPFIRIIFSMGFYFWLMIFAALYVLYAKEYEKLLWMLPMWSYMGTSFLGPTALLRYAYPVMLGAPMLLFFVVKTLRKNKGAP